MINSAFPLIKIIVRNRSLLSAFLSFYRSVLSNSLWPHELQHARLPCPSVKPSNHLILCWPLSSFTVNLSQHQGFFQWVSSSHQVAKPEAGLGLTSQNWPSPWPWQFIQRWTSDQGGPVRVNLGAWLKLVGKRSYLCYSGYKLGASELHCCCLIT